MSRPISVRPADRTDCPAIMGLKQELAIHQNMADKPMLSYQELEKDGFDTNPPSFKCLVAGVQVPSETDTKTRGTKIVGFALYFYAYAAWEGKVIHLEDLCTSKSFRGQGIGSALLKALAKVGLEKNCKRIQLEVLDWNESALKFYDKNGGTNTTALEGWHNFRLDKEAIRKLASS